jgi:hypothetical protein
MLRTSLSINLSKAFDTVAMPSCWRLKKVGLSVDALDWFQNYLSDRTQCVAQEGMKSEFQRQLFQLKLGLNERKTKFMVFSFLKGNRWTHLQIRTITGQQIDRFSSYKYLGMWLDEKLNFKQHIDNFTTKLKLKMSFYFMNKSCFSM